ncbi:MAG: glycosyltransferase family 4 protein [Desulfosarcina sp.]|nr:glycosyltransferase family 4 protein [Desulfobacterales bacterium]
MAEALALSGCEVHVVAYHLGSITTEEEQKLPFKIHRIRNVPTYKKFSAGPTLQKLMVVDSLLFWKLKKIVSGLRVDIVHAHHYEGLIASLLLPKYNRVPIIYDAHTLLESELHFYWSELAEPLARRLGQFLDGRLPIRADHVITVTPDIRDKLIARAGIQPERISVIMSGVEIEHFGRPTCGVGHDQSIKKIVYAGGLSSFQGINHFLQIFVRIGKLRRNVKLQIITNDCFQPYLTLARQLGIESQIEITPSSYEKLPEYLKAADVVLNPRVECDGIPQKLLNYMAAGRPVVSFEGSAKIIEHYKTGYIVENENYEAFAKAVLYLLDNCEIAEAMGSRAKEFIRRNFSWKSKARDIMDVYERLLG